MDTIAGIYGAQPFWVWAALGAALLAVEVLTGSGWLLWAAASATATAAIVALVHPNVPTAILIFAVLTLVSTLLARRYLPRTTGTKAGDINDTAGRLGGHPGRARCARRAGGGRRTGGTAGAWGRGPASRGPGSGARPGRGAPPSRESSGR